MKHCFSCGTTKPESEFHKRSRAKDGLQSWCKRCQQGYDKSDSAIAERRRRRRMAKARDKEGLRVMLLRVKEWIVSIKTESAYINQTKGQILSEIDALELERT